MKEKIIRYLNFVIYWAIVLIPFSIAIAPGMTFSFMGLLAFSYICKKLIKRERPIINTAVSIPFLLLIIVSLISFKNTIDFRASIQGITKLLQDILLLLICAPLHTIPIFSASCI